MKGKITFLFGASLGYVLGARAGRQRYEQIKAGTIAVWETPTVQRCANTVRGFVGTRVQTAQNFVVSKGKQVLHSATKPSQADLRTAAQSEEKTYERQPAKKSTASSPKAGSAKKSAESSAKTGAEKADSAKRSSSSSSKKDSAKKSANTSGTAK